MSDKGNDGGKGKGKGFLSKMKKSVKNLGKKNSSSSYQQQSLQINDQRRVRRTLINTDDETSGGEDATNDFVVQSRVPEQSNYENAGAGEAEPTESVYEQLREDAVTVPDIPTTSGNQRRRGSASAVEPSEITKLKKLSFQGEALVGDQLSGWFRPQMQRRLDGFWPRWTDVPGEVKSDIYNALWKEYTLEDESRRDEVYSVIMQQFGVIYRKMLSDMKLRPMRARHLETPAGLINVPRPGYLKNDDLWHAFIRHCNSEEQMRRSKTNKVNRKSYDGSSHGYGRKSIATRLHEMEVQGKVPSMVTVITETNKKKNKNNQPTGEVHNKILEKTLDEYNKRFKEKHGKDKNTEVEEFDMRLWSEFPEVAKKTRQCRVLGLGYSTKTSTLKNPECSTSTGLHSSVRSTMEEMMREQRARDQEESDRRIVEALQAQELRFQEQELRIHEQERRSREQEQQMQSQMSEMYSQMQAMRAIFESMQGKNAATPSPGVVIHDVVAQTQNVPRTQQNDEEEGEEEDDEDDDEEYDDANDDDNV